MSTNPSWWAGGCCAASSAASSTTTQTRPDLRRVLFAALIGCAHGQVGPPGFGLSKERAIEVCLPTGEKAYLESLRCPDGSPAKPRRVGSIGSRMEPVDPNDPRILLQMDPERPLAPGEPDLHIVDAVEAHCKGAVYTLFFDMYHCPAPPQPPPGGLQR